MTLPDESENYIHRIGRVGRADRMGLALSFVSKHKEKVWYHRCKNRGRGCTNTKLLDKGGCTIWYDEPGLIQAVEKRLGNPVDHIVPAVAGHGKHHERYSYMLPPDIAGVAFGEERTAASEDNEHVAAIAPRVQVLSKLETQVQRSFHELKARFHKPA